MNGNDLQEEEFFGEDKCNNCKKDGVACISYFAHENAMMHKDMDNERMHETMKMMSERHSMDIRNIFIGFFAVILLLVATYTIRNGIWNETIRQMNAAIVELANAQSHSTP